MAYITYRGHVRYYYLGILLVSYYIVAILRSQSFPDIIVIYLISNKFIAPPNPMCFISFSSVYNIIIIIVTVVVL